MDKTISELRKENKQLRQRIERFEREKFEMSNTIESFKETIEKQVN